MGCVGTPQHVMFVTQGGAFAVQKCRNEVKEKDKSQVTMYMKRERCAFRWPLKWQNALERNLLNQESDRGWSCRTTQAIFLLSLISACSVLSVRGALLPSFPSLHLSCLLTILSPVGFPRGRVAALQHVLLIKYKTNTAPGFQLHLFLPCAWTFSFLKLINSFSLLLEKLYNSLWNSQWYMLYAGTEG